MITQFDAERGVLGTMLRNNGVIEKVMEHLRPEDFGDSANRTVFSAMLTIAMRGRKLDLITLDEELEKQGLLEQVGGPQHLVDLSRSVPTGAVIDPYIEIVLEKAGLRRLDAVAESIRRNTQKGELTSDQIIERAEGVFNEITSRAIHRDRGWITGARALCLAHGAIQDRQPPVPTGMTELDDLLCGGLRKSELTIVGARPGKGKSALLLWCAMNAVLAGQNVGYLSLEMSSVQIGQRMLAIASAINLSRQRKGDLSPKEWDILDEGMKKFGQTPLFDRLHVYEGYSLTVERLGNIARHAVLRGELDLLVVDYLQLLRTAERTSAEYERIGIISKALKQMALSLDIPILTAAQVRRPSQDDSRKGGRAPTLDELRGSGDLEQDADNVLLIHVPDSPEDPTMKRIREAHEGIWKRAADAGARPFTVEVAKQRQGATGRTWCQFQPATMRFIPDRPNPA